jgi:hypothetical protein
MLSLFSEQKPREGGETTRSLPPDLRQLIVDVHTELPIQGYFQKYAGEHGNIVMEAVVLTH